MRDRLRSVHAEVDAPARATARASPFGWRGDCCRSPWITEEKTIALRRCPGDRVERWPVRIADALELAALTAALLARWPKAAPRVIAFAEEGEGAFAAFDPGGTCRSRARGVQGRR
jgi:hypothetical protein